MLRRFVEDHDRLRSIIAEFDRHLKSSQAPTDVAFARLRWTLARQVAVHVALERRALPDMFARTATPDLYRGLDHDLDCELNRQMTEWTASAIEASWAEYRSITANLLARLRRRMVFEEKKIFPALA